MSAYREFFELFLRGYGRGWMALAICLISILVALLEGINIGLLVPLLDTLQSSGDATRGHWISRGVATTFGWAHIPFSLGTVLLGLGGVLAVQQALKYGRMVLVARTREGFVLWMRSKMFWNLVRMDLGYFHGRKLGTIVDTLTTQTNKAGDAFYFIVEIFAGLGVLAGYLAAAVLLSPLLAMISLGLLGAATLALQYSLARSKTWGVRLVERSNLLQAAAVEYLSGIRVIKSFAIEREGCRQFEKRAGEVGEALYRLERNNAQMTVTQETAVFILAGVLVFLAVSWLRLGSSVVLTFLFVLYRVAPKVTYLNSRRHSLAACLGSLRSVKTAVEETSAPRIAAGHVAFGGLRVAIRFERVSFAYDSHGFALRNVTLTIDKGRTTAIVGASGAGKSTLVDLLVRFDDPQEGRITVDGLDMRELDLDLWRRVIGVVGQDVFLFNDTIFNNIACWRPGVTEADVVRAAKLAHAHEFISLLPAGYDAPVGDRGVGLSGGERQRLALARALALRPEVLILDEATSALDSESEQGIRESLRALRGACTIVMIAHRLSTVEEADTIVVLEEGGVAEQGDRASLLANGGIFARYHRLQAGVVGATDARAAGGS